MTQEWISTLKADATNRLLPVALFLALAAGCAPREPPDIALFTSPCLTEGALDEVRPIVPVDYLELRERRNSDSAYRVLSAEGTECDSAQDPVTCQGKFTSLPTGPGFHQCYQYDCGHSLAMTQGDVVKSYTNTGDLLAFLGPIDTPLEAVLYVYAQGYDISCLNPATGGVRVSLDGNGFEVLASLVTHPCNPTAITGYHYQVTTDGQLVMLGHWLVSSFDSEPCQ